MNMVTAKKLSLPTAKEIHAKLQQDRLKRNVKGQETSLNDISIGNEAGSTPIEVSQIEIEASINAMSDRKDTHGSASYFFCVRFCKWTRCFTSS